MLLYSLASINLGWYVPGPGVGAGLSQLTFDLGMEKLGRLDCTLAEYAPGPGTVVSLPSEGLFSLPMIIFLA